MKQLILRLVPESYHASFHRNICLRFGGGFTTQLRLIANVLAIVLLILLFLKWVQEL